MNTEVVRERLARARTQMQHAGLDYLFIGPSSDLRYLTGAVVNPSERLSLLLLPQVGPAYLIAPGFEAVGLPALPDDVRVLPWGETDSPPRIVASLVSTGLGVKPGGASLTIGVGERLWSGFLLDLQAELPRATFTSASSVMSALRRVKTPDEIALLVKSGALADEVFRIIAQRPFSGRTEEDVAREISSLLEERGIRIEHPPIVGAGPNGASPHHHAGDRRIVSGDVVVLDFGGPFEGYYSDITRTVFVGGLPADSSEEARVYRLVAQAQQRAFEAARPGMTCAALDAVARQHIAAAGYGEFFNHRLGHGVGLDGHEPPYIVSGNDFTLQPGMAFSIEPGVYLPGRFGVRVEDLVYLTETQAVRLNNAPRQMLSVE